MRVQDLDAKNSAANTDELIITDSSHKSWRITFANFFTSIWSAITSFASLSITTLLSVTGNLEVTGDTALADASITGDADITGDLDVTGDVNITGGLEVTGDIIQHGSAYETHAQKVYTKDDVINLRDGAIAGLAADEYAGVIAKHYDADGNDGALVFNRTGEARVGDYTVSNVTVYSSDGITFYTDAEMTEPATIPAGITPQLVSGTEYSYTVTDDDTEPLLTRDEMANMTNGAFLKWDGVNKKAVTVQNVEAQIITIIANSKTFTGLALEAGSTLSVLFTSAIAAVTLEGLTINYNNVDIPVKVYKNNTLVNFEPVYNLIYIQAYTRIELLYDGTQFIIIGNPIVYRHNRFTVRADGSVDGGAIGDVKAVALTTVPYGWLECNGQEVSRSTYAALFTYFNTEAVEVSEGDYKTLLEIYGEGNGSTTFNLPDYREAALVGAGENDTDTIETDDVYTLGQFKDDALQNINGRFSMRNMQTNASATTGYIDGCFSDTMYDSSASGIQSASSPGKRTEIKFNSKYCTRNDADADVTRGKRKGVMYVIKVK